MRARNNPLRAYAFDTEAHPFIIKGKPTLREHHVGVHTATNEELAALYAVLRAMVGGTLAILFDLDVTGLRALPDRDAILKAEQTDATGILDIDGVIEAVEEGDGELAQELIDEYLASAESWRERDNFDTWTGGMQDKVEEWQENAEARAIINMSDDDALTALRVLMERRTFPARVWMEAVGQQRYLDDFDLDRVVRVRAIRPVREELWTYEERNETGEDYPPDDGDEPEVFSEEDFFDDRFMPEMVTLWENPKARARPKVEYHGTDIVRALEAFPELKTFLVNPWPYSQEAEPMGAPTIWTPPQAFIEAEAAARQGVGVFPRALDTGRWLLGERSWAVNDAGQWAGFGGTLGFNEDPVKGALRELREETRYAGPATLTEIAPNIFVADVPTEFEPRLNWETEMAAWFDSSEVPRLEPLHWGTTVLIREIIGE